MTFKDLFSQGAPDYARFRPHYPQPLFAWLATQVQRRNLALDIGAGSGQAAVALGAFFDRVIALDPSPQQLARAPAAGNVQCRVGTAEATGLDAASADLVVAAQAFHWFKHERFFAEVGRVLRPGGCLAVWCYGLTAITPELDAVVYQLYEGYLGPYWEPERKLVEDGYRQVTFPFPEIAAPSFVMHLDWTFEHLAGYLGTWSPLDRYIQDRGEDPLQLILPRLREAWGGAPERTISWPITVRAFRLGP